MKKQSWGAKPYYSLDYYLKETFHEKVYKLSLDGGMTCPNRDGTLDTGGCIFCSHGGSGDFAEKRLASVYEQIETAKLQVADKSSAKKYIAYFQSYTNTYAPLPYLERLFSDALDHPDVVLLSIATRPDCLDEQVICLLKKLSQRKPVWVELGLQTIHEETADRIHRRYPLSVFKQAFARLKEAGIPVITHVILGLPGETPEMIFETVKYLGRLHTDGIKLQLLHILKDTELERLYQSHPFHAFSLDEYAKLICNCIALLPPDIVIHRISGDGPKNLLVAPPWSGNKRLVLNTIAKALKENQIYQGMLWEDTCP